jgi:Fe-S-cluster containining protein
VSDGTTRRPLTLDALVRPTSDADANADATQDTPLPAGDFSSWLAGMQRALAGDGESDVPCDGCTACCTSSQFVHVEPDEADARAHIPAELLFPAPRMPAGHLLLGYDEHGRCPMLVDGGCSIYAHRPRTCRTYDCRVFPAAGLEPDEGDKPAIARRARRWRFAFPTDADEVEREAVVAAARYVRARADALPDDVVPATATQHAVLAVRVHDVFLRRDDTGRSTVVVPEPEDVRVVIAARVRRRPPR